MTAFNTAFRDDPRYQRKLQRIASKGDNYAGLVKAFMTQSAGAEMDKQIQFAGYGAQERRGKKALALGNRRLDVTSDISMKNIASREKTAGRSQALSEKAFASNVARAGRRLDVSEDRLGDRERQDKYGALVAATGIPIEIGLRGRESKKRKALAEDRKRLYALNLPEDVSANYESMYGEA